MFTTDARVARTFAKYSVDVDAGSREHVQCRGPIAKESAHYPPLMAREFWKARQSPKSVMFSSVVETLSSSGAHAMVGKPSGANDSVCSGDGHRHRDSLPHIPLWCAPVVQIVNPLPKEAGCPAAKLTIDKELSSINSKRV